MLNAWKVLEHEEQVKKQRKFLNVKPGLNYKYSWHEPRSRYGKA